VLGGEFRPLYEDGAVFSTFKTPFVAPASTARTTSMRGPDGRLYNIPTDKVAEAEKDGFRRE
jgi:hypothetical protein